MHAVNFDESGVGVFGYIFVVVRQDALHELILHGGLRLDHVASIVRVEEKLARLGVREKLDEVVVTYLIQ